MAKLKIGMFEGQENEQWMKPSGIKFDYRYRYLTEGWANNWGYGANDGAFAGTFFQDCDAKGFIPAVAYYCAFDLAPGGLGSYDKLKNISSQQKFFNDLKLFFQQARTFGKEVLLCVEPDLTGFLQGELKGLNLTPSSAYAAVAATGIPELQGLQDTVAGWGKAFVVLRNVLGATNVKLGLHVSGWSSGRDVLYGNVSDSFQPDVDQTLAFLTPMGLSQYDVLVTDPIDRDADFYGTGLEYPKQNRWFTMAENDSVNSMSFNRYFAWLKAFNTATNKEFVCWQIPLGNANSPNIPHDPRKTSGYKSNHVEYFFGPNGAANRARAMASGVTTLLFGEGEYRQTSRLTDGGYFKSIATSYINGTGDTAVTPTLPTIPAPVTVTPASPPVLSDTSVNAGWKLSKVTDTQYNCLFDQAMVTPPVVIPPVVVVPPVVTPPVVAPPVVTPPTSTYQFDFEGSMQGWTKIGNTGVVSTLSSDNAFAASGAKSLKIVLAGVGTQQVSVANPSVPAGSKISFSIYIPKTSISSLKSLQVFAQESTPTKWRWNAQWIDATTLKGDAWNAFTLIIPSDASAIQSMGIEITTTASNAGTLYLDAVGWGGTGAPPVVVDPPPVVTPPVVVPEPLPPVVVTPPVVTPPVVTGVLRISTIGDSITESVNSSWRCGLVPLLKAQGITPQFVGTQNHQYSSCTEGKLHDGYPGKTAEDIASMSPYLIRTNNPDVVVFGAGANTGLWWSMETGSQAGARWEKFLNDMFAAKADLRVVAWTCGPYGNRTIPGINMSSDTWFNQYNDQIRAAVTKLQSQGKKIVLVDMAKVLTASDAYDGVHPSEAAGKTKMAPAFLSGILQVLNK